MVRHNVTIEVLQAAIFMGIRDELNRIFQCPEFLDMPRILSHVEVNTRKPKRKRKAKP
jgi:hypothetical protein